MTYVPDQPNVSMRRVKSFPEKPGEFFFFIPRSGDDGHACIEPFHGLTPTYIHFVTNRGEHQVIPIYVGDKVVNPSWHWDGNWDAPTLTPSLLVSGQKINDDGEPVRDAAGKPVMEVRWHGFVRGGVVGFEC